MARKNLLSKAFFDFQGGMKPHTSLEIELFCGTMKYASPFANEVFQEIDRHNFNDGVDEANINFDRFFISRENQERFCMGNGNYRRHFFGF